MATAEMVTYAYDQIDQARAELNSSLVIERELSRSVHRLDQVSRSLAPEDWVGSFVEVVE